MLGNGAISQTPIAAVPQTKVAATVADPHNVISQPSIHHRPTYRLV